MIVILRAFRAQPRLPSRRANESASSFHGGMFVHGKLGTQLNTKEKTNATFAGVGTPGRQMHRGGRPTCDRPTV
jgi:hypothetical protein